MLKHMMKSEKEMIYFEEVDRIKVFRGVNKQLVLGRGINRNIMEFKGRRNTKQLCRSRELIET